MFKIAAILTSAAMLCTGTLLAAAPEASAACTEPAQAVQRCTVQRHAYIRICGDWWEIPLRPGEELPAQPPEEAARERSMQQTLLAIREKYGKDAVLKAMSLQDGATARTRFHQIGGHRA